MEREKVKSSHIEEVGWEDNKMEVVFNTGDVYLYQPVPREVYNEIVEAKSVGEKFHELIRSNEAIHYRRVKK